MSLRIYCIFFALLFLFIPMLNVSAQELTVVSTVDYTKYTGVWYEIARLPNPFQKKCVGDVTATYTLLDDGTFSIVNRCLLENGEINEAEGKAKRLDDDAEEAKLKVRFAPAFLSFLPFVWGDYWIIELAPDYSYAVIGEPSKEYLWILSRTPTMEEDQLTTLIDTITKKGYNLSGLLRTKQTGKKN